MSRYIHGAGTFVLKIHASVVWGGGNLYNLDEMERKMIFYRTTKNISNYSVLEKSAYHLIVAISVELPKYEKSGVGKNSPSRKMVSKIWCRKKFSGSEKQY